MLKVVILALSLTTLAVAAKAADGEKPAHERPELTAEQKKERADIIGKYDKNKDGKLDAEEKKAMTAEDREKLAKLSGHAPKKKDADK